jgi:XRE family aerobic/anaerobic benzoate catabolism transcriptional regulator
MLNLKKIGRRVSTLRKQRKLTREQLGVAGGSTGNTVRRVELGEGNITLGTLDGIAVALGTTVDALVRE